MANASLSVTLHLRSALESTLLAKAIGLSMLLQSTWLKTASRAIPLASQASRKFLVKSGGVSLV